MDITCTIIAYDEEADIAEAIRSARRICDEVVVVVDAKTTDATAAEAEREGALVTIQEYLGDGPQKKYAASLARHDWVLSLDADERLDEDCVGAIAKVDLADTNVDAYSLRRKNYVGEHRITAAGFYPDRVTRLYNRQRAEYSPRKGHAQVEARHLQNLDAHLIHASYRNYEHWLQRINDLTTRDAWALYHEGRRPTRWSPTRHMLVAFFRKYLLKGGIFQGVDGITVTLTTMVRTYFKYMKLREAMESQHDPESKPVNPPGSPPPE